MTDYAEERRSEIEVLESIFPAELTIIAADQLAIRIEPETQPRHVEYALLLKIHYTEHYPDEAPRIELESESGDLTEDELGRLLRGLQSTAADSLGMAMVFTLSQYLRDSITQVLEERKEAERRQDQERSRLEEEELARKNAGTKVTLESFTAWRDNFEREMDEVKRKREEEWLRALASKEREEVKKQAGKLTGRQLFERDLTGKLSKEAEEDEEGVDVDFALYERKAMLDDEEQERLAFDSDSDT